MNLTIRGNRPIKDVQQDFSVGYPFLKIEFFKNGFSRKEKYPHQQQIPRSLHIKDAWFNKKTEGDLVINDMMSVLELEKTFMDRFGLSVQVFRKSGSLWLKTTITDKWTLKQQNDHGREISTETRQDTPGDYDYD